MTAPARAKSHPPGAAAAAAWAKYYQAVERANDDADKAKKDPNANAASIDAQRNANKSAVILIVRDGRSHFFQNASP